MTPSPHQLRERLVVLAELVFDTGWRIGSGEEGETMSDLGVVLDVAGTPILPGSSLKGKLRSTCETLAHALECTACLLNCQASDIRCVSDVNYFRDAKSGHQQAIREGLESQLAWIEEHTCDVCKLFGSPVRASRLRIADGCLIDTSAAVVQVRDGVVLDRDSHTAVNGLKYDYEVVGAGTRFRLRIEVDNPSESDRALLGVALFDWSSGNSLGGFTSRGLGRFRLEGISLRGADLAVPKERLGYLTGRDADSRLQDRGSWEEYFQRAVENATTSK